MAPRQCLLTKTQARGDFLPYSFKRMELGPLIGKRTWGGLIGISANPQLVDGGSMTVPFFRFYARETVAN